MLEEYIKMEIKTLNKMEIRTKTNMKKIRDYYRILRIVSAEDLK